MPQQLEARKTHLHNWHISHEGRMIVFAGFDMPVWYERTGTISEHMAVRNSVGVFDITHMGRIRATGLQSRRFLNHLTTNDLARLRSRSSHYTLMCNRDGGIIDDLFVYRYDRHVFYVVVNASNREKDLNWLLKRSAKYNVVVEDISDSTPMFAVQGRNAEATLQKLTDAKLAEIPRFGIDKIKLNGFDVLISRTGYTGEDGFEVSQFNVPLQDPHKAVQLFEAILEAGEEFGIVPCGLGCRDTLRLEAGMPLYGEDIDEHTTPLEARLRYFVKFRKKSFVGKSALLQQRSEGLKRLRIGLVLLDKGIPRTGYEILRGGKVIGQATSGSYSPVLQKGIAVGYVRAKYAKKGMIVAVKIRERLVKAEVIKMPASFIPRK
nr:glycine cleavage system aminomethyltransferase GcvT [Candidatus Njordarchaeota archaeon]